MDQAAWKSEGQEGRERETKGVLRERQAQVRGQESILAEIGLAQ